MRVFCIVFLTTFLCLAAISGMAQVVPIAPSFADPEKFNITLQFHIQYDFDVFERNIGYFDPDTLEPARPSGTYLALFAHAGDGTYAPGRGYSLLEQAQLHGATISVFLLPGTIYGKTHFRSSEFVPVGRDPAVVIRERIDTLRQVMSQPNVEFYIHEHGGSTVFEMNREFMDEYFYRRLIMYNEAIGPAGYPVTVPESVPARIIRVPWPGGYCIVPHNFHNTTAEASSMVRGVTERAYHDECGEGLGWFFGTGNYSDLIYYNLTGSRKLVTSHYKELLTFWSNGGVGENPAEVQTCKGSASVVYIQTNPNECNWAFPGMRLEDFKAPDGTQKCLDFVEFPERVDELWHDYFHTRPRTTDPDPCEKEFPSYSPQSHFVQFRNVVTEDRLPGIIARGLPTENLRLTEPNDTKIGLFGHDLHLAKTYISHRDKVNYTTMWENYRAFLVFTGHTPPFSY